jgi:hypothetical protein
MAVVWGCAGSGGGFTGGSLWLVLILELEFVRESCLSGEGGRERDEGMSHKIYAGNAAMGPYTFRVCRIESREDGVVHGAA